MIDSSCGIISGLKRKKQGGYDRINYYDLNNDYEEHNKIIEHINMKYNIQEYEKEEC